jgi:hypothetical protein
MITVTLTPEQIAIAADALGCRRTRWGVLSTLQLDHVCPPVESRSMDYGVFRPGQEEAGYLGWGATPQAAVDDAIEWLEMSL